CWLIRWSRRTRGYPPHDSPSGVAGSMLADGPTAAPSRGRKSRSTGRLRPHSRVVLATALVARLAFIPQQTVALVAWLAFIAQLTDCRRGDPLFELFDLQVELLNRLIHFTHGELLSSVSGLRRLDLRLAATTARIQTLGERIPGRRRGLSFCCRGSRTEREWANVPYAARVAGQPGRAGRPSPC